MPAFREIYAHHADLYERLVAREDCEGRLLPALAAICPLHGLDVGEFGAGTGRVTALLAPHVHTIYAFDASHHMLGVAARRLRGMGNVWLAVADNRALPLPSAVADLAVEGWSFGHATDWYPDRWQMHIGGALAEMRRVLRPGGVMILIETLGTGRTSPQPPTAELAAFYAWLEGEQGFSHMWVRTDYRFASLQEAEMLVRFFFGDDLADRVARERLALLPECTGLWWRVVQADRLGA